MKKMKKLTAAMLAGTVMTAALPVFPVFAEDTPAEEPVTFNAEITLSGTSAAATGEHAKVDGTKITIDASGAYLFSGTLDDGQIVVNIPDTTADPETVKLYFNGVSITGKTQAAVYVINAENTSVNIMDGTENILSDGTDVYADTTGTTAVVYAKDDITFKSGGAEGTGKLKIEATANHGIHCNNDVKFTGASVKIKTDAEDGVRGKSSVKVKDGKLDINAEGDGIKSTKGAVEISGGDTEIKAGNDAVQGETAVKISGGSLKANGDRALTNVSTAAGNAISVTGGTILATSTDAQTIISGNTQPVLLYHTAEEQVKDQRIELYPAGKSENPVFSKNPNKKFSYVMISAPELKAGENYDIYLGGQKATGYTLDGAAKEGCVFTLAEGITTLDAVTFPAKSEEHNLDIDDNGVVDVADAVLLARLLAEDREVIVPPVALTRTDCNGDGSVDGLDVVLILRKIARLV